MSPGTVPRPPSPLRLALADIMIAHSVFALPFAVLGAFLATPLFTPGGAGLRPVAGPARDGAIGPPPGWLGDRPIARFLAQLALVVVCMVLARTWAMLVNRLADRRFDRDNPRTARRALASGRLGVRQALAIALGCAALFVGVCALYWPLFDNPWPLTLSVPVLAWIAFYSFTKRFTWLCHVFLGGALAASPLAAAIAVDAMGWLSAGPFAPPAATLLALAAFVALWVAGFDVAYALQDLDFDRRTGLRSIPAALGPRGALWAARALHAGALAMLVVAWRAESRLGWLFVAGVVLVGAILLFEHVVLARRGVAGLPLAFFTLNGCISLTLGSLGCLDVAL